MCCYEPEIVTVNLLCSFSVFFLCMHTYMCVCVCVCRERERQMSREEREISRENGFEVKPS